MSQEQNKTISGSVFDTYTLRSQEYKENRMPRVGQTVEFEDGRKYVFVSSKVDVAVGLTVAGPAVVAEAASANAGAGMYAVSVVKTGVAANIYNGGYLQIDATGTIYKIKKNTATATVLGVADTVVITLYDSLQVAVTAADVVNITPPQTTDVVLGTAGSNIQGVSHVATTAATDALGATTAFFWAQYQGVGPMAGVALAVGNAVMADAAGAVALQTAGFKQLGEVIAESTANSTVRWHIQGGC